MVEVVRLHRAVGNPLAAHATRLGRQRLLLALGMAADATARGDDDGEAGRCGRLPFRRWLSPRFRGCFVRPASSAG